MSALTRTRCALLLIAASAALAGCGGEDQETGSSPAAPTATVTETATVTATTTVTDTASPAHSPRPRGCGQVAFETNTDAGAFDIRASEVDCQVAREVARGAEGQGGARYAAAEGFDCRPTGTVGQLPSVVYECTREKGGTVTFRAS